MAPFDAMRTIIDIPAQAVEAGCSGTRIDAAHDGRNVGLLERRGVDDLPVAELALAQFEPQPLGKIARAGACAAGGRLRVRVASRERCPLAVDLHVQRGAIGPGHEIAVARAGRGHAERLVEPFLGGLRPALARHARRSDRALGEAEIAVGIAAAEAEGRLGKTQAAEDFPLGVAELLEVVADAARQSAAMGEQVADRDLRRGIGLVQRKAGIDIADAGVPRQVTVTHERGNDGRGNRLGERRELKHRIGVDPFACARFPDAEACEIDHLVVLDDGDRQTGHLALGDGLLGERLQAGQRREHLLPGRRLGGGGSRQERCRENGAHCYTQHSTLPVTLSRHSPDEPLEYREASILPASREAMGCQTVDIEPESIGLRFTR